MAARRIHDEPAFILHSHDWSESSLIVEVFTRHWGRQTLVAKGAKKPTSNFRPVLLALQPLHLSYSMAGDGSADIHPLKGAQWMGGHTMPTGEALLSGLYLNELLLRLLARDDAHADLFDLYAAVVRVLAGTEGEAIEPVLRAFELLLLRHLGLLPDLAQETPTQTPLQPLQPYALTPELGLCAAPALDLCAAPARSGTLCGAQWTALALALDGAQDGGGYLDVLRACAPLAGAIKPVLRALLQYHCGSPLLRTRQLMMDLQAL